MRNRRDVSIDRKQVRCTNASMLGFGQYKARFGDFVTFGERDGGKDTVKFGRIGGRVTITSALEYGKVYLLVITVGQDGSHAFERFVSPEDILTIVRPKDFDASALTYLLSDQFTKQSTETLRETYSEGWSTPDKYLAWRAQQAKERAEYNERHKDCASSPCDFHVKFAATLAKAN